ncbi:hypothetical protein K2173_025682 [Erythroxylum novogranatense]|uniref:Uncharacterized protein n=1 Tax=Erythroxylum novogranatense TaxID=1862640 RepID=A0AAV8SBA3_9ROSI|nr:hypothetical protein K2173_025682 [Erythroxylum novogranatense]
MATSTSSSCLKPPVWRSYVKDRRCIFPILNFRPQSRKHFCTSYKLVQFSARKNHGASPCLGSLVDIDGASASDWVSISDQLLLMTSILLTYMAGVVPIRNSNFISRKNPLADDLVLESSESFGRVKDDLVNLGYPWDAVKAKLLDSLDALEHRSDIRNSALEVDQHCSNRPLSLYALSEGPKLRLLLTCLRKLQEEMSNVLHDCKSGNMDNWMTVFAETVRRCCQPIYMAWLEEEVSHHKDMCGREIFSLMVAKLNADDSVLQNIRKSGKTGLYAELFYFLRYGSLWKCSYYDQNFFVSNGNSILEDLVITLADGVASAYLELISVDGNLSNEINALGLDMCNFSTRALQKLRNEVALNQWLYQNIEAVVSIYEDRFDLSTFQLKVIKEPSQNQAENFSWWRKFALRKPVTTSSSLYYIVISQCSLPVKRTMELRALNGWRYYFSLYLELSDITMPFIRAVVKQVSNAISFFLVSLIGRSLGLVYSGIRQALRWK